MKKFLFTVLLLAGMAGYVCGEANLTTFTINDSHLFMSGDTTTSETQSVTTYHELGVNYEDYRIGKTFYQADIHAATIVSETVTVTIQTGTGGLDGYWIDLAEYIITQDSFITTSGWDLVVNITAESLYQRMRLKVIMQSDSTGNGDMKDVSDSTFLITHTLEVLARE